MSPLPPSACLTSLSFIVTFQKCFVPETQGTCSQREHAYILVFSQVVLVNYREEFPQQFCVVQRPICTHAALY